MTDPEVNDVILFRSEEKFYIGKVIQVYKVFVTSVSVNDAKVDFAKKRIPKSKSQNFSIVCYTTGLFSITTDI